jgi:hypothetical protein
MYKALLVEVEVLALCWSIVLLLPLMLGGAHAKTCGAANTVMDKQTHTKARTVSRRDELLVILHFDNNNHYVT